MLTIFLTILLPVFAVAALGALLDRWFRFDPAQLTRLSLFLFSPALVFTSMARSTLDMREMGGIALFVVLLTVLLVGAGDVLSRVFGIRGPDRNAFLLSVTLMNAGNMGLPITLLALGQEGLDRAVIFFVASSVVSNSVGVVLARQGLVSNREALLNVFRLPQIYALAAGLAVKFGGVTLPETVMKPFELLAGAAVPVLLVILGIRLSRVRLSASAPWIALATGVRLAVAPVLALAVAMALGLDGLTRQVVVLESSMPTAVFATVLAIQFEVDSDIVAGTIAASTLASGVTLSVVMWAMGIG